MKWLTAQSSLIHFTFTPCGRDCLQWDSIHSGSVCIWHTFYLIPFRIAENLITQMWSIHQKQQHHLGACYRHITITSSFTAALLNHFTNWFTWTCKFEICWPRPVTRAGCSAFITKALESQGRGTAPETLAFGAKFREHQKLNYQDK